MSRSRTARDRTARQEKDRSRKMKSSELVDGFKDIESSELLNVSKDMASSELVSRSGPSPSLFITSFKKEKDVYLRLCKTSKTVDIYIVLNL